MHALKREWVPTAVAGGIAILLVWLAGDPLALRPEDVRVGGPLWWGDPAFLRVPKIALLEPRGDVSGFPRSFRWRSVPGASAYEITVGRDVPGAPPLVRQRGTSTSLEIAVLDSASAPGWGSYAWDVRATRGEEILARGLGRFRVVAEADVPARP